MVDERVDEAGEAAIRGAVVDLFPADAGTPYRLELEGDRIGGIRRYDALTQRTAGDVEELTVGPASELLVAPELLTAGADAPEWLRLVLDGPPESSRRRPGTEHLLPWPIHGSKPCPSCCRTRPSCSSPRTRSGGRPSSSWCGTPSRAGARSRAWAAATLLEPERLYLGEEEWERAVAGRTRVALGAPEEESALPPLVGTPDPRRAFVRLASERLEAGDRVVVAAADGREAGRLARLVQRETGTAPEAAPGWDEALAAAPGALATVAAPLPAGFACPASRWSPRPTCWGGARRRVPARPTRRPSCPRASTSATAWSTPTTAWRSCADSSRWRRAGASTSCSNMRAGTGRWCRRSRSTGCGATARPRARRRSTGSRARPGEAQGRGRGRDRRGGADAGPGRGRARGRKAPALVPDRRRYARFAGRFPYAPTDDQAAAIDATLADLARGAPPMDRLVCGDVGYGKTEVALRAAAAAALAGKQVAVLAPTTVLVRQHLTTFRRRFAGLGVRVEQLSRLARTAEARATREGLADGSVQIVVGTHALASPGVRFKDLGLVVIDEEQRFGTRQKGALRRLRQGVHVLTMSATPIPRTLQSALAGIQELSVIATPPVRRQPVRTFVLPFDRRWSARPCCASGRGAGAASWSARASPTSGRWQSGWRGPCRSSRSRPRTAA